MRALIASVLVAATALTPLSVSAKTYEEAAASGVSPVTANEMLDCALYWNTWSASLNPDHYGTGKGIWDSKWLSTLNPAIQLPAAQETAEFWFKRAQAEYKAYDEQDEMDKRIKSAPEYDIEALDERKFMQLLGECARPTK
jgi:hypothetical protein